MSQLKIIGHQFLQKMHGSCTICQCMENLKVNSFFIIAYLEQQILFVWNIKSATGRFFFFLYNRRNITAFQIEPEKSFAKDHLAAKGIFRRFYQERPEGALDLHFRLIHSRNGTLLCHFFRLPVERQVLRCPSFLQFEYPFFNFYIFPL